MHQLHLVGFTEDHDGLIFSTRRDAATGAYVVGIDDALFSALEEARRATSADGDDASSRAAADRVKALRVTQRSSLSVRDIQSRLRSGMTLAEVAREAGVDEGWVGRFAAPVLAEQSAVVERALPLTFTTARKGASSRTLGDSVRWNLVDRGILIDAGPQAAGWSAFQMAPGQWGVRFTYTSRGRQQVAEWEISPDGSELTARNRLASELGYVEVGARRRVQSEAPVAPVPAAAKKATSGRRGRPARTETARAQAANATSSKAAAARSKSAQPVAKPAAKAPPPSKRTAAPAAATRRAAPPAKRSTAAAAPAPEPTEPPPPTPGTARFPAPRPAAARQVGTRAPAPARDRFQSAPPAPSTVRRAAPPPPQKVRQAPAASARPSRAAPGPTARPTSEPTLRRVAPPARATAPRVSADARPMPVADISPPAAGPEPVKAGPAVRRLTPTPSTPPAVARPAARPSIPRPAPAAPEPPVQAVQPEAEPSRPRPAPASVRPVGGGDGRPTILIIDAERASDRRRS